MKNIYCCAKLLLLLFSVGSFAQVPTPPLAAPSGGEKDISFNYILGEKNRLAYYGKGGELTATHLVTKNVGFQAETDYLRTDFQNLRDFGMRIGPIIRFRTSHPFQPYAHVLVGMAIIKSSYLTPDTFHGAPSILAGGGLDFPIAGAWHARVGLDIENDWTATATRVGRATVGIAYRFGTR